MTDVMLFVYSQKKLLNHLSQTFHKKKNKVENIFTVRAYEADVVKLCNHRVKISKQYTKVIL